MTFLQKASIPTVGAGSRSSWQEIVAVQRIHSAYSLDRARLCALSGQRGGRWEQSPTLPMREGERTRLIYRIRFSAPALARVFTVFFEPADFLSSRKMLIGIKRRAETHALHAPATPREPTEATTPIVGVA
jgi:hypothetical protein